MLRAFESSFSRWMRRNVVERPTRGQGSRGYAITGHHEILVPLLAGAVLADLGPGPGGSRG